MSQTLQASAYTILSFLVRFITVMRTSFPRIIFPHRGSTALWGLVALAFVVVAPAGALPSDHVKVFVSFDRTPGATEQAIVSAAGGTIHYSYTIVTAIAVTVPEAALSGLLRNPRVTGIEPVRSVHAISELSDTWGVEHIGSGAVHVSGNEGSPVLVAIIDTGIDCNHSDLLCPEVGHDFAYGDDDPADGDGHGTHVAGTVAAIYNGHGVVGVAPQAGLVPLKVLDDNGNGDWADVIAALQWIYDYNAVDGPDILVTNNSYTDSAYPGDTVRDAFQALYDQGVLHVAAAGNSGKRGRINTMGYPARFSSNIAVAATDKTDARASFSSVGNEMEVAAPGVDINSTLPGGGYGLKSGTSMASPHVAGVAALVIASGVTGPDTVRLRLKGTADDLGKGGWDTETGYGLVDADEAAGVTGEPPTNQPPTASFDYSCTELSCNFDASGSSDADGSIVNYAWGFGDGSTGSGVNTSNTYTADGTYTVTLTVTDDGGLNDTVSRDVTVSSGGTGGDFTLTASGYKVKGRQKADLEWLGAGGEKVDIYRDGAIVENTDNDGLYTDDINNKGSGSYAYQICEAGSTSTCSNAATVNF